MRKARNILTRFWNDEGGAVGAEYTLLLALIAMGMAVAALTLGTEIGLAIDDAADCIQDSATC